MFKVGDIVRPMFLDNGGYDHLSHNSGVLTLDKDYEVTDVNSDDTQMIRIQNDFGDYVWMYATRFSKTEIGSNETSVIRKIRQMEEKRKSLGYRW